MTDKRVFNQSSPAFRAMDTATERIFADIRAGGPWAGKVVAAKTYKQTRIGTNSFDGPARRPRLSERLRGLEPLPPSVIIDWSDDNHLYVFAFGLPDGYPRFAHEVEVREDNIDESADELVRLVDEGLKFVDPMKTEAIKVYRLSSGAKDAYPWLIAGPEEKRPDGWNV